MATLDLTPTQGYCIKKVAAWLGRTTDTVGMCTCSTGGGLGADCTRAALCRALLFLYGAVEMVSRLLRWYRDCCHSHALVYLELSGKEELSGNGSIPYFFGLG